MLGKIISSNNWLCTINESDYKQQVCNGAYYHLHRLYFVKTAKDRFAVVSVNLIQRITATLLKFLTLGFCNYYQTLLNEKQAELIYTEAPIIQFEKDEKERIESMINWGLSSRTSFADAKSNTSVISVILNHKQKTNAELKIQPQKNEIVPHKRKQIEATLRFMLLERDDIKGYSIERDDVFAVYKNSEFPHNVTVIKKEDIERIHETMSKLPLIDCNGLKSHQVSWVKLIYQAYFDYALHENHPTVFWNIREQDDKFMDQLVKAGLIHEWSIDYLYVQKYVAKLVPNAFLSRHILTWRNLAVIEAEEASQN